MGIPVYPYLVACPSPAARKGPDIATVSPAAAARVAAGRRHQSRSRDPYAGGAGDPGPGRAVEGGITGLPVRECKCVCAVSLDCLGSVLMEFTAASGGGAGRGAGAGAGLTKAGICR